MTARKGKIASLPREIRQQLNERLLDGEFAPQILPWLNSLPEVKERLATRARAGEGEVPEITDGNLSEWRAGGFQDWCQDVKVRDLNTFVSRMADAAGQPPESLLRRVWTGKMLETAEKLSLENPDAFMDLGKTIATISAAAHREEAHADKTRQTDTKLALEKIKVARAFVKFYDDARARELAESARSDDAQLPLLADFLLGTPDIERLKGN